MNEMNKKETPEQKDTTLFPATVVEIVSDFKLVINRGSDHKIKQGDRFLIYGLGEKELTDPETGESLGILEIVRGTGNVVHVQNKMSTIQSIMEHKSGRKIVRRKPSGIFAISAFMESETIEYPAESDTLPFEAPKIGDKARPI